MEAYVCIAIGQKYVQEAATLLRSIRKFDAHRPAILLSDSSTPQNGFTQVIDITKDARIQEQQSAHNKWCVAARVAALEYVPETYRRFIMIDTDVLCISSPAWIWQKSLTHFESHGVPALFVRGEETQEFHTWHWGHMNEIIRSCGRPITPMHGGFLMCNRNSPHWITFVKDLNYSLANYDKLGFRRTFRGSNMTDEPLFSFAAQPHGPHSLHISDFPAMSLCLPLEKIHTKTVTFDQRKFYSTEHICSFNHFAGMHEFASVHNLYNRFLNAPPR